ncbi:MAG: hypothetical protein QOH71_1740 [Blastocatellia bacterium]|jgi:hypothetical protein|nr:hypothetical protein [Blastocatellia bacterium]
MHNPKQEHDPQRKEFLDAGFTPEKVGTVTIYTRAVSKDVIEASIAFAKRTIGYTSKDIPGRKKGRR